MHVVVLGAGLAGLSAAHALSARGARVTVLERDDHVGGMASSWKVGPYWLDHGPHRFYTRDAELLAHIYDVLDGEVVVRERKSRICLLGKFFDYPLNASNVVRNLPPGLLAHALFDYASARVVDLFRPMPDANFEDWVVKRFGRTLYDLFFGTYTAKAWRMPCNQISADWASQRISQANLWDAIAKTLWPPKSDDVRSLASEFHYPAHGGIGQLARKYAEKIEAAGGEIRLSTPVETLAVEGERITRVTARNQHGELESIDCDSVISTIPLSVALQALQRGGESMLRAEEQRAIAALRYIGIVFVYLEVQKPHVIPDHWMYLPSTDLTIHRITEFKNFSDSVAPGSSTVVCCEITCRPGDERWKLTLDEAARIAGDDLARIGVLPVGQGRGIEIARLGHAYPVYDLDYARNLEVLRSAAKRVENFATTGRQGLYRYNNMDHSVAMGRRMAAALLESGASADADAVAAGREYFG